MPAIIIALRWATGIARTGEPANGEVARAEREFQPFAIHNS